MAMSLMQDPPGGSSLQVIEAVKQGWQAFARAPWVFVGFTLLAGVLSTICSLIQGQVEIDEATVMTGVELIRALIGSILSVLVSLWSTTGLIRGAWTALAGGSPGLGTFTRWDGQASWRLLRNGLVLGILFAAILVVAALVGMAAAQLNKVLAVLPFLVAFAVVIYLAVNQKFLAQIALLEGCGTGGLNRPRPRSARSPVGLGAAARPAGTGHRPAGPAGLLRGAARGGSGDPLHQHGRLPPGVRHRRPHRTAGGAGGLSRRIGPWHHGQGSIPLPSQTPHGVGSSRLRPLAYRGCRHAPSPGRPHLDPGRPTG